MNGQWIGRYSGIQQGNIIINIDEHSSFYQGIAFLHDSNPTIPKTAVYFRTINKERNFRFNTTDIRPINPATNLIDDWQNVRRHYPLARMSKEVLGNGSWDDAFLTLSWTSDIDVRGNCLLTRSKADQLSELVPLEHTWESYKSLAAEYASNRYLYRGQTNPKRLRTAFHRTGRADIIRYLKEDIPILYRNLSARTKHVFNLHNPNENGSFFNLIQHHGFPTPLLDWTYSPYIAAFFAYRGLSIKESEEAQPEDKVRIFVFDQELWKSKRVQSNNLADANLHVSIGEYLAIENERMVPQQAASTITNVDDIESHIKAKEIEDEANYLRGIDLPKNERQKVIKELSYMGITAGSMFPGLDGACEELKERNF